MATLNANLPYTECYVREQYVKPNGTGVMPGYIFGAKAMINRPMHFHFLSSIGAIFWQLPISAFCHREDYDVLSDNEQTRLQLLQTWDCQSNSIAVTTFSFLQNKRVDVHCRDDQWRSGRYICTIDDYDGDPNELNVGYANDQDSKCYQFIQLDDGNYCIQPNNLLRWHNADYIIPYDINNVPKLKVYKDRMYSEDVDRTYGNSAYYFYQQKDQK